MQPVEKLATQDSRRGFIRMFTHSMTIALLLAVSPANGWSQALDWQARVHKYAEARDWNSAMRVVEQEIARAPQDMDVRAWRARVLAWSGRLAEAEREYLEVLKVSQADPDNWLGLAEVYLGEGQIQEAQRAIDTAEKLDPKRADLHAARARVLRAAGEQAQAQMEFQEALNQDPASVEARAGMNSLGHPTKHELRFGQDNDLLNYTDDYHSEWASLVSRWTEKWATSIAGDFYQRGGSGAGKFVGSVTRTQAKWGALTAGGAVGHDNTLIPKNEAFFDLDHGWKISETNIARGVEFVYGQHWYWYQSARILTLSGTALMYLPQDWTFTLSITGARSAFSGTGPDWRPSGFTRLGFPLMGWNDKRLTGNVFFAVGTEDFAETEQIGSFASQTYGTGLRCQFTDRQDVTGYVAYQKRTQSRTDTSVGLSYGIHF